jgi:hypothetical protein
MTTTPNFDDLTPPDELRARWGDLWENGSTDAEPDIQAARWGARHGWEHGWAAGGGGHAPRFTTTSTEDYSMSQTMFYVAEDPQQPGAAFASCVDRPEFAKATAKDVADWIKRGAIIRRVDGETMKQMLSAWKQP